jgi:hypothetical protein
VRFIYSIRSTQARSLLASLLLVGAVSGCREGPPAAPSRPAAPAEPEQAPIEPAEPERTGVLYTLVTSIGNAAPAGSLEAIGAIRVTITTEGGLSSQLELPVGGSGMLWLPDATGNGLLLIEAISPSREGVGRNEIEIANLGGTIGVIGFSVAATTPGSACGRCSEPEVLTELRGLHETYLYWSAGSHTVAGPDERLHVAVRSTVSAEERHTLLERAGGRIISEDPADESGSVWVIVAPAEGADTMTLAANLARSSEIRGMEVFQPVGTGHLWP